MSTGGPREGGDDGAELYGLAHVATVSFLASRAAPALAFWIALAGGVAVARAAAVHGFRAGAAASTAAMLQTIALIGPARVSGPLTQAFTAPVLGAMEGRGRGPSTQMAACVALRYLHYTVVSLLAIYVLVGVEAYTGVYDRFFGWFLPEGRNAALVSTALGNLAWAVFFSVVQVIVYRRGLRRWPVAAIEERMTAEVDHAAWEPDRAVRLRTAALFTLLAVAAWTVLLSIGLRAEVLVAVGLALGVGWLRYPPPPTVRKVGGVFAALLGVGALVGNLVGGLGIEEGLARGARAALLVLVATWLRGAAGSEGLRAVASRSLRALRAHRTADLLGTLDSGPRLAAAGRALVDRLEPVERRPAPIADAMVGWVAAEAASGGGSTR